MHCSAIFICCLFSHNQLLCMVNLSILPPDLRQELSIKGTDKSEPDNDRATERTRLTSTTPIALQKKQFIQPPPKLDLSSLPIGESNVVDSNKIALNSTHPDSTPSTPGIRKEGKCRERRPFTGNILIRKERHR